MDESEFESQAITPEIVASEKLDLVIKETGIDVALGLEFQANFYEHFKMASTWAKKAKNIIVTDASQTVMMQEARTARLFLREKRLEIENFRKQKKEYYVRGGQAIDKVASFLKNMIEPIEHHLDLQEHYVEYKNKAEDERLLTEARARKEARLAEESKKDALEKERLRLENENLRKEAQEKERINQEELKKILEKNAEILRIEREKTSKAEVELRAKQQAEAKAEADRLKATDKLKFADDEYKLMDFRNQISILLSKAPEVKSNKYIRMIEDCTSHLHLAFISIKITEEEV